MYGCRTQFCTTSPPPDCSPTPTDCSLTPTDPRLIPKGPQKDPKRTQKDPKRIRKSLKPSTNTFWNVPWGHVTALPPPRECNSLELRPCVCTSHCLLCLAVLYVELAIAFCEEGGDSRRGEEEDALLHSGSAGQES